MKIVNSVSLSLFILTIGLILYTLAALHHFIILSVVIFGTGAYGGLFELLLFGFYGESLRTGKPRFMLRFPFLVVIIILFQSFININVAFHLDILEGILYESPLALLFVLSIILYLRVRSKIKGTKSDKTPNQMKE